MKVIETNSYAAPPDVDRLGATALIVGVVGLVICAIGAFVIPAGFFRAYLIGYVFWTGISVGSLALMMLHHLTGGGWGVVIRRLLEASTRVLPLLAVLFVPIAIGLFTHQLYPWTIPEEVAKSPALQHKQPYLNIPFFLGRTVFFFVAWMALAYFLNKWSLEQDGAVDPRVQRGLKERLQSVSGPGILVFGGTVTFAAFDWVMSLEPEWSSTMFGLLIMVGWGLSALAFTIAVAAWLAQRAPMDHVYRPVHFHDHGKLLLAFIMLWAYFSFSQFLIIWSGNLPEEIPWYLERLRGGWQYVGLALVVLHFALPFALLLSRDLKRHARTLSIVAVLVLLMRVVDLFWLIAPSAALQQATMGARLFSYALSFIAPIGIGGLWVWYYMRQLKQRPLMPIGDEGMENALHPSGAH